MAKPRVLIVAAHPDDEVLGAGGTIAALAATHEVRILILGEGVSARYARRGQASARDLQRLRTQARVAARLLGAAGVECSGLPDNRFDQVALLDIVKCVEQALARMKPTVVYTHHPGDLNIDHQLTFRAVLTATRPLPDAGVRELYAFEIPSSSEWSFHRTGPAFQPTMFVNITRTLEKKIRALQVYRGEVRRFPHPRSPEALRAIAHRWGSVVGVNAAEAFELIRAVR